MGLTSGTLKNASGQLLLNTRIDFYLNNVWKAADDTDANGRYALTLAGPNQYQAKVGTTVCTPNPMNVPSGTAVINLVKP